MESYMEIATVAMPSAVTHSSRQCARLGSRTDPIELGYTRFSAGNILTFITLKLLYVKSLKYTHNLAPDISL